MKVEILIYAYLAICAAMILFNIVCAFLFRRRDKKLVRRSKKLTEKIEDQIERGEVDAAHRRYLSKKLRKVNHLMAFDATLEAIYPKRPQEIKTYIEALSSVFVYLTLEYRKKNKLQAAYFPYIIKKYNVFHGQEISIIIDAMLELVRDSSMYCRENALQALYSIGNVESVVSALHILDSSLHYHHPKLITDGLLSFRGNVQKLSDRLWQQLPEFSVRMQVTILDYFRFHSGDHCVPMLRLLLDESQSEEVHYACIRYFGKYHYEPAYPHLLDLAENEQTARWEYTAIAASSLASYPAPRTNEALKRLLSSRNWFVRYNASQSLERLGLDYVDLIDVFEGDDRYAGEMMRYRFDQKKMRDKEAVSV